MKLNHRAESEAFGRLQVQHTEAPQAQQIPEADPKQNLGFPAQEQDLTKKSADTLIFASQVVARGFPSTHGQHSALQKTTTQMLLRNTGERWQHHPPPQHQ